MNNLKIYKVMIYFRWMDFLVVSNVSKKEGENYQVLNVSFSQQRLEKIAIAGETGSGKSTLIKMIGGLVQKDAGELRFENSKIIGPYDQLIPGHPGIAYLSQHFELRNNYWVHEILEYANKLTDEEAMDLYEVCRIKHLLQRRTNQLSGGEKQRIALARILIGKPKLLLLDEPFSNLDNLHKNSIKAIIEDIGNRLNISCLMISHDAADILSWADKILIMKDGELVQTGTPAQIYFQPVNEYCAALFGNYNLLHPSVINNQQVFSQGEKIVIRPEQLIFVQEGEQQLTGIVKRNLFCGSYYIIEVLVNNKIVSVKSDTSNFSIGDTVFLRTINQDFWFIKD